MLKVVVLPLICSINNCDSAGTRLQQPSHCQEKGGPASDVVWTQECRTFSGAVGNFETSASASVASGDVVGRAKTQLRHPLQVLSQSKQDIQQLQATNTAQLVEIQDAQANRDNAHFQKHEQQKKVRPAGQLLPAL